MNPVALKAAAGVRNDVPLERFGVADLASGSNIDIDETGAITRRLGVSQVIAGAAHSGWSDGNSAFLVHSSTLKQLFPDGSTVSLKTGMPSIRVNFATIGGATFWSNGVSSGRIKDGQNLDWGIVPPAAPTLTPTMGSLPAGRYSVCLTAVRADGHESGASLVRQIDVGDNSGIVIALPVTTGAAEHRIYISSVDGGTPYYAGAELNGVSSYTLTVLTLGMVCRTQFKAPPPPGQLVGHAFGRAWVARENYLFYSDPFEYELFDRRSGFMGFPSRVTMFLPMPDGIFVGLADSTLFLAGTSVEEMQQRQLFPYGVVEGTGRIVRGDLLMRENAPEYAALWLSKQGVCMGNPGGTAKNLTGDRYIMPESLGQGASLMKIKSGTPHFVITTS